MPTPQPGQRKESNAMAGLGQLARKGVHGVEDSYFADCPRDQDGRCQPKGAGDSFAARAKAKVLGRPGTPRHAASVGAAGALGGLAASYAAKRATDKAVDVAGGVVQGAADRAMDTVQGAADRAVGATFDAVAGAAGSLAKKGMDAAAKWAKRNRMDIRSPREIGEGRVKAAGFSPGAGPGDRPYFMQTPEGKTFWFKDRPTLRLNMRQHGVQDPAKHTKDFPDWNPKREASYFATCPRDQGGQCAPSGSGGSSADGQSQPQTRPGAKPPGLWQDQPTGRDTQPATKRPKPQSGQQDSRDTSGVKNAAKALAVGAAAGVGAAGLVHGGAAAIAGVNALLKGTGQASKMARAITGSKMPKEKRQKLYRDYTAAWKNADDFETRRQLTNQYLSNFTPSEVAKGITDVSGGADLQVSAEFFKKYDSWADLARAKDSPIEFRDQRGKLWRFSQSEGLALTDQPAVVYPTSDATETAPAKTTAPVDLEHFRDENEKKKSLARAMGHDEESAVESNRVSFRHEQRQLLEVQVNGEGGGVARMILITEGPGNRGDRNFYPAEALQKSVKVFEGKKCFVDHQGRKDEENQPERSSFEICGWFRNCRLERIGGKLAITADLHFVENDVGTRARGLLKSALSYQRQAPQDDQVLAGLSINGAGPARKELIDGEDWNYVEEITEAMSVDLVTFPARGGKAMALQESERWIGTQSRIRAYRRLSRRAMESDQDAIPWISTIRNDLRTLLEQQTPEEKVLEGRAGTLEDLLAKADRVEETQKIEDVSALTRALRAFVGDELERVLAHQEEMKAQPAPQEEEGPLGAQQPNLAQESEGGAMDATTKAKAEADGFGRYDGDGAAAEADGYGKYGDHVVEMAPEEPAAEVADALPPNELATGAEMEEPEPEATMETGACPNCGHTAGGEGEVPGGVVTAQPHQESARADLEQGERAELLRLRAGERQRQKMVRATEAIKKAGLGEFVSPDELVDVQESAWGLTLKQISMASRNYGTGERAMPGPVETRESNRDDGGSALDFAKSAFGEDTVH